MKFELMALACLAGGTAGEPPAESVRALLDQTLVCN